MDIGIYSRTFVRETLEEVLDASEAHGLSQLHFNLKSAAVESLPDELTREFCLRVRRAFETRGFVMTSISATFNAIHPDLERRELDTVRACRIIERCRDMGTSLVTLCTGTRDPHDMWRRHPDNHKPDAWQDLLATLSRLLPVAERSGVVLGLEPERGNVLDSARKARQLLDELQSPHIKIVMDGANLFEAHDVACMHTTLTEAFALLGPDMIMAHAKDIADDPTDTCQAAGTGRLDWSTYCRLLKENGYEGPVVLHNLRECEIEGSVSFLKSHLARWYPEMRIKPRIGSERYLAEV